MLQLHALGASHTDVSDLCLRPVHCLFTITALVVFLVLPCSQQLPYFQSLLVCSFHHLSHTFPSGKGGHSDTHPCPHRTNLLCMA